MTRGRCQGCGQYVDTDDPDVIVEQIPGGPLITDHEDCHRKMNEAAERALGKVEPPEGGWPKGSDMDRI